MIAIALRDVDRPALPIALGARGMRVANPGEAAVAVLVAGAREAGATSVVEAADPAELVAALDAGVGDAILCSDSDAVAAARIGALIRRLSPATIALGDLAIDTIERRVTRQGRRVPLLPREYALLLHLARAPSVTHDRAKLRAAVWGMDFDPGTNVIEVHMSRLRAKLDRDALPIILTDKGRGYRLVPVEPAPLTASG